MRTDNYYEIGLSHEVCEDYAFSGNLNEHISYAIVADGCSSAEQVDVGARVLVHSAIEFLREYYSLSDSIETDKDIFEHKLRNSVIAKSIMVVKQLGLPLHSLCSTLIVSIMDKTRANVFMYGDGAVAVKYCNGDFLRYKVEYESGAPYYLIYSSNKEDDILYASNYGNTKTIKTKWDTPKDKDIVINTETISRYDFEHYQNTCFSFLNPEVVSVMSDGVNSFRGFVDGDNLSLTLEPVDTIKVVDRMTNFKNFHGQFVNRRMKRFNKNCTKDGWSHYDDVSIASIFNEFNENNENNNA